MSVCRITTCLFAVFLCASASLHAEYYVVSVDSASPAVQMFFRSDIIELPENTVLQQSYHFVFDRENDPDAKWLLVTPPPRADSVGELLAGFLKFAWAPLSDGLRLHVYVRCTKMSAIQTQSTTFLSGTNVAFATALGISYAYAAHSDADVVTREASKNGYDTLRAQQLFKKNVAEREPRASGTVTVSVFVSNSGYVDFMSIANSTNPKLNASALRTAACIVFEKSSEEVKTGWGSVLLSIGAK